MEESRLHTDKIKDRSLHSNLITFELLGLNGQECHLNRKHCIYDLWRWLHGIFLHFMLLTGTYPERFSGRSSEGCDLVRFRFIAACACVRAHKIFFSIAKSCNNLCYATLYVYIVRSLEIPPRSLPSCLGTVIVSWKILFVIMSCRVAFIAIEIHAGANLKDIKNILTLIFICLLFPKNIWWLH